MRACWWWIIRCSYRWEGWFCCTSLPRHESTESTQSSRYSVCALWLLRFVSFVHACVESGRDCKIDEKRKWGTISLNEMLFFANYSIERIQRSCSRLWYSKNSTDYSSESNIKMLQYICFRSVVESPRCCCRWLYHNCIHDKEAPNDGIFSRLFFRSWFSREWRMIASMHCSNARRWTVEDSSPKTPFSQRSIKYLDSFNPVYHHRNRFSLSIVTANASQESYLYRMHAHPAPCALIWQHIHVLT